MGIPLSRPCTTETYLHTNACPDVNEPSADSQAAYSASKEPTTTSPRRSFREEPGPRPMDMSRLDPSIPPVTAARTDLATSRGMDGRTRADRTLSPSQLRVDAGHGKTQTVMNLMKPSPAYLINNPSLISVDAPPDPAPKRARGDDGGSCLPSSQSPSPPDSPARSARSRRLSPHQLWVPAGRAAPASAIAFSASYPAPRSAGAGIR